MTYSEYFRIATRDCDGRNGLEVLGYQARYQESRTLHSVLSVPTGLGKTDTALIDWLYRLKFGGALRTRRLAWTLPGRALANQVADVVRRRIANLAGTGLRPVKVCLLMGGSGDNDLKLAPDEPAVLVGTQDLLVSRALNRGYARSPFHWPIDFALLNNDITWVFDEVQLLGDSLATSAQLAAFRERFRVFGATPSVWMSATMKPDWLATVDFGKGIHDVSVIQIAAAEVSPGSLERKRLQAPKQLQMAPGACRLPSGCAHFILENHRPATLSLVVANTVERAREIHQALGAESRPGAPELVLLHSRFRPDDRRSHIAKLLSPIPAEGRIVVSTQVIEAGIDISAAVMVTDAAPLASMVQRFGRVNRAGEMIDPGANIYWVDLPLREKRKVWSEAAELKTDELKEVYGPYVVADVQQSISVLQETQSAAPADLKAAVSGPPWKHVLRRADLLDLFDTTPDLGGNQIDVSRFVRSGEDLNVFVAWREDPERGDEVQDSELCPVPLGEARAFAEKHNAWIWDPVRERWRVLESRKTESTQWYPGLTIVFASKEGGYTSAHGWSPTSAGAVSAVVHHSEGQDSLSSDRLSFLRERRSLVEHTDDVVREFNRILSGLTEMGLDHFLPELEVAARKHDWGKSHNVMQRTLYGGDPDPTLLLAKSDAGTGWHSQRYFRHELASALAMLQSGDSSLAVYIVAAHHGKIRLGLRSMPGERENGKEFTRGIEEGDVLPECELGGGVHVPAIRLELEPVFMGSGTGRQSWNDQMISLLEEIGPFRLAYLEMLLRVADQQASANLAVAK